MLSTIESVARRVSLSPHLGHEAQGGMFLVYLTLEKLAAGLTAAIIMNKHVQFIFQVFSEVTKVPRYLFK